MAVLIITSDTFQQCVASFPNYSDGQNLKEQPPAFIAIPARLVSIGVVCTGHFIDRKQGLVSAIAAVIIAYFTYTLYVATRTLGNAAEQQARDARESLNIGARAADAATRQADISVAVERPIFVMHNMLIRQIDPEYRITFKNYGRTPAIVIADCLHLRAASFLEPPYRIPLHAHKPQRQDHVVNHGESHNVERKAALSDEDWAQALAGKTVLWAYGYIDYVDFLKEEWREGFVFGCRPARITPAERIHDGSPTGSVVWERVGPHALRYTKRRKEAQGEQDAAEAVEAAAEAAEESEI